MDPVAMVDPSTSGTPTEISLAIAASNWLVEKKLSRGFWIFFAVAFFFDLGFAVYFFLFNLFLVDIHFNERTIGMVGGALTLGSVAGTLPAGWLGRKISLRPLLACCLIAAPAMGVARTLVTAEWPQITLAFLAGVAMSLWGVCFLPIVAMLTTKENRASAFSLIYSVSIGTSALGGVVCGYVPQWLARAGLVLQPAEAKQIILIAACSLPMLGIIPWLRLRIPLSEAVSSPDKRDDRRPRETYRFLLRFLPAMALWSAVVGSFASFATVYLSKDLHIPLPQIGLVSSAAQVLQLSVGLTTPLLFRWLGLERGVAATQVATALGLGLLAGTSNRGTAIALFLSISATQWMSSPGLYNVLLSNVPDHERGWASAATLFCNAVLQSGATAAAGILLAKIGYPRTLATASALAFIAAFLFVVLIVPRARDAHAMS